jgi:hypothetical protein
MRLSDLTSQPWGQWSPLTRFGTAKLVPGSWFSSSWPAAEPSRFVAAAHHPNHDKRAAWGAAVEVVVQPPGSPLSTTLLFLLTTLFVSSGLPLPALLSRGALMPESDQGNKVPTPWAARHTYAGPRRSALIDRASVSLLTLAYPLRYRRSGNEQPWVH